MKTKKKCICIKETMNYDIKIGGIYVFDDYGNKKFIHITFKGCVYGRFICDEEYFNNHFEVIK